MYKETKIPFDNGFYSVKKYDDYELQNPIELIRDICIQSSKSFDRNILIAKGFNNPSERILNKFAYKRCNKRIQDYRRTKFPKKLINLLNASSKKEQKKCLKGLHLNHKQFYSFIFYAFENYNFKLSQYKSEHHHKNLDQSKLPEVIHIENDSVNIIGKTELTEGQLKNVVKYRKVIATKILENEDNWHCFFFTFKSMKGEEKHNNGQPHFHYISNKWNINKTEVIKQLTSEKYGLPSIPHITYHR